MNLKIKWLAALAPLLAVSCATMSTQDIEMVNRAKTIQKYPVSRANLIKKLGLQSIQSQRLGGGVRSGTMFFTETWTLSSGSEITAWDSKFIGDVEIKPATIDAMVGVGEYPYDVVLGTRGGKRASNINKPVIEPIRKSFNAVRISSVRGKEYFDSSDPR